MKKTSMLSFLRAFFLSQNGLIKVLFAQKTIHLVVQEQVEEKKKAKKCFACHKQCRAVCFSVSGAVYGTEQQNLGICRHCNQSELIPRKKKKNKSKQGHYLAVLSFGWVNTAVCAVSSPHP